MHPIGIFWFRRDFRIHDNCGLYHALRSNLPILPIFIWDSDILAYLQPNNPRVYFINLAIYKLDKELQQLQSALLIFQGKTTEVFAKILAKYSVAAVFANEDYEPYGLERDLQVQKMLQSKGIPLQLFQDHVIFGPNAVLKKDQQPYKIYTAYAKQWKKQWALAKIKPYSSENFTSNFYQTKPFPGIGLTKLGFQSIPLPIPKAEMDIAVLKKYAENRNFPSIQGTSRLGVHLRFGTISIRNLALLASQSSPIFLNELIWREFFCQILYHFPHVVHEPFRTMFQNMPWRDSKEDFERWCQGQTGYPMVDAGMRELNQTGYMHNRVRMITASFLTKHLLLPWQWGESYFKQKLLDYELSSNNGNWQWSAGCGCDAAPYFRIFNPTLQQKKFDPKLSYVQTWVPEVFTQQYAKEIVNHSQASMRALRAYAKIKA